MKTRVGIVGTSGAMMADGWRAAFERIAPDFEVVGNASLGSSHPAMLPYRLPLLADTGLDVLIVDLCVNEQRALNRNLYDPDSAEQYFDWLRGWCADRGVLPVVLILPLLAEGEMMPAAMADRWAVLCRNAGLPFLDGYRLIRHAGFYSDGQPRDFFANPNHLNGRGAGLVAGALAATLSQFLLRATVGTCAGQACDFRFVHAGGTERRATGIVSERMLSLGLGEVRPMRTGPGDVTGVVLDMARCDGALQITGAQSLVKRLDTAHAAPDGPLRLVAWSLMTPVTAQDGRVVLSVVPSRLIAGQEDNDHSVPGRVPASRTPRVEIAGLVLRGPAGRCRLVTAEGAPPDLLTLLD